MQWIKEKKIVTPVLIGNWKVVPEDWWQKGKEKDYELLFDEKQKPVQTKTDTPEN